MNMNSSELFAEVSKCLLEIQEKYLNERREYMELVWEDFRRNGVDVEDSDDADDSNDAENVKLPADVVPPVEKLPQSPVEFDSTENQENEDPSLPEPEIDLNVKCVKIKSVPEKTTKKIKEQPMNHCVFCFNNGERYKVFTSHRVRDKNNRVVCPRLMAYTCPTCNKRGLHTMKYCPQKKIVTPEEVYVPFKRGNIRI